MTRVKVERCIIKIMEWRTRKNNEGRPPSWADLIEGAICILFRKTIA